MRGGVATVVPVRMTPIAATLAMVQVQASALSPDLRPETQLDRQEIREASPRDPGELVRQLPGVDAVRRGPVGLDPSVRGLRETEVGVYLDGTRMFPGGPARMDSPLSHVDPSTMRDIQVVKGPYALTWGAGNLTAIRVTTQELPPPVTGPLHGTLTSGYDGNYAATNVAGSAFGSGGRASYWVHGAWRDGNNYTSGNGTLVPAEFHSSEARGKLGWRTGDASMFTVGGGYQGQGPIDYPGRLLNADFFHTWTTNADWTLRRDDGTLRGLQAQAYVNAVHHGMTNAGKPTALADPDRMPPFALDVKVNAHVRVAGGRVSADLAPSPDWRLTAGGDVYSADRDAVRRIRRAGSGMLMFEDLMWPNATITDGGVYLQGTHALGDAVSASATGRVDFVRATADSVSEFFRQNSTGNLKSTETNLSGAFTVRADLSPVWTLSLGIGSAVRTADATERYSDRVPASKAQTSAEFVGNPQLAPERSTQGDVWLEGRWRRTSLQLNAFGRRVTDYITLEPTALPRRLPLSPSIVYRYVNGNATYWGAEASLGVTVAPPLLLSLGGSWLWGDNTTLDEPALGVAPWRADVGLRFEPDTRYYLQGTTHLVGRQDRVETTAGEQPTPGYTTVELRGGFRPTSALELRAGVQNLTDVQYVNHLNARNPFTGDRVAEPGRVVFVSATWVY